MDPTQEQLGLREEECEEHLNTVNVADDGIHLDHGWFGPVFHKTAEVLDSTALPAGLVNLMLRLESADFAFDLESQIQVSCCQQVVVDESIESTL